MIVGVNAGPFCVGPINAAPISEIPCGKNDKSFSRVNTPGLTILSAIIFLRLIEIKTNNKSIEIYGKKIELIPKTTEINGNIVETHNYKIIDKNGVKIMGDSNILNKLPTSASNLYAKNVFNFVSNLYDKEKNKININLEDEIIEKTLIK